MTLTDMMAYSYSNDATSVRLPYAGDRYTMTLTMPDDDTDFNDMVRDLEGSSLNEISSGLRPGRVALRLPKFQHESNSDIIRILQDMGLDRTCFPGIMNASEGPLELKVFQHAAKIIVNEKGTEGGAASLGGFFATSTLDPEAMPVEQISFDRPFIYTIQDNISGTVLFMGAATSF